MLGLGRDLEGHDGQGSVDEAHAEADQQPADEGHPHGNSRNQKRADRDRADCHECAPSDGKATPPDRIVHARLGNCSHRPRERPQRDPPGGGGLGPGMYPLKDQGNHDGQTDL